MTARTFTRTYRFCYLVLRIPVRLITRHRWQGAENMPPDRPFIVVANHATILDALTFMDFIVSNGHPVKILAKAVLFKVPILGWMMRATKQVPVFRGSERSADALKSARNAINAGECIAIFPEGTLTRDPDMWPMKAKTGAARLALATGVEVIPVAQWGAHRALGRYRKVPAFPFPRKWVDVVAGTPVKLDDLVGRDDIEAFTEANERIMGRITEQLAQLRGEEAPEKVWDPKTDGYSTKRELGRATRKTEGLAARIFRSRSRSKDES